MLIKLAKDYKIFDGALSAALSAIISKLGAVGVGALAILKNGNFYSVRDHRY